MSRPLSIAVAPVTAHCLSWPASSRSKASAHLRFGAAREEIFARAFDEQDFDVTELFSSNSST